MDADDFMTVAEVSSILKLNQAPYLVTKSLRGRSLADLDRDRPEQALRK